MLEIGSSLIPDVSFTAVPIYASVKKKRKQSSSAISLDSTIGEDSGFGQIEEPGYDTIPYNQNPVQVQTIENPQKDINLTVPKIAEHSFDNLYAVPQKKIQVAQKVLETSIHEQINGLYTLKAMLNKTNQDTYSTSFGSESGPIPLEINELESEEITNDDENNFMEILQEKLLKLRLQVLETVNENKVFKDQKEKWLKELSEVNQIISENIALKENMKSLQEQTNGIQKEAQTTKVNLKTLQTKLELEYEEIEQLKADNEALQEKCRLLQRERKELMPICEHHQLISEIKSLLEHLKDNHNADIESRNKQILKSQKDTHKTKIAIKDLNQELALLKTENQSLRESLRTSNAKCRYLTKELNLAREWNETAQELLEAVMSVAEQNIEENGYLEKEVKTSHKSHMNIIESLMERNVSLGRIQEGLENFKLSSFEKLEEMETEMEITKIDANESKAYLEKQLRLMKEVIRRKDAELEKLMREKLTLEEEIENVWK